MTKKIFIPFRLRAGADSRRFDNLEVVTLWWRTHGYEPVIVSDGGSGDEQFNRHRAYNRAVEEHPDERVYVFSEADMLIHPDQIRHAVNLAHERHGLVVPFTEYRYLADSTTSFLRNTVYSMSDPTRDEWLSLPAKNPNSLFDMRAESVMEDGKSIGAVNVVSATTLRLTGGFTEATHGNWYDDNIIEEAFKFLTRQTRWVKGPAVHLYHLPGWQGDHLTAEDRAATKHNKKILETLRGMIEKKDAKGVRELMSVRKTD